jgi:FAD/FMN-containing dehydrogenase
VALPGIREAVALAGSLRRELSDVQALELVGAAALELSAARAGAARPTGAGPGPAILVEVAGGEAAADRLGAVLAGAGAVDDAVVAMDEPGIRRLWQLRESISEAVNAAGVPHKLDVVIPAINLADFDERSGPLAASVHPGARVITWGHLAEGNLHVNVLGPAPDDEAVDDAILRLVLELGGSIGAEHGIGRAKARWLPLARDATDVAVMRAIKNALDPTGLLNPGVLFSPPS